MTERKRISKKTYIYYFDITEEKLAYWLFYHKYAENPKVESCSCTGTFGNDKAHTYELMVTYK